MANPLVTVLTPTYNHAHYLGRVIESLLAQTYPNWEMMIIDDGSTDHTAQLVRSFNDPRIRYHYQANKGVTRLAETLNVGLSMTSGELVTAFMSDDIWPPDRLERQVPVFEDTRVVLSFARGIIIDENEVELSEFPLPAFARAELNRPVGSVLNSLLVNNWIPEYTELIARWGLEKIGGYLQPPGALAEDWPTHLALALVGEFRYVDFVAGYYRMHGHQQTRNIRLDMAKTDRTMVLNFYQRLTDTQRALAGISEEEVDHELTVAINNAYFMHGRRLLLAGNRRDAARNFLTAIRLGNAYTKVKAVAGLLCTASPVNLEWLAGLAGRPRLR